MNFRTICLGLGLLLTACGSPPGGEAGALAGEELDSLPQALVSPLPTGNRYVSGTLTVKNYPVTPTMPASFTGPASFTLVFSPGNVALVSCTMGGLCGYRVQFTRTGDNSFSASIPMAGWSKKADLTLVINPSTGEGEVRLNVTNRTYTTSSRWEFTGTMAP